MAVPRFGSTDSANGDQVLFGRAVKTPRRLAHTGATPSRTSPFNSLNIKKLEKQNTDTRSRGLQQLTPPPSDSEEGVTKKRKRDESISMPVSKKLKQGIEHGSKATTTISKADIPLPSIEKPDFSHGWSREPGGRLRSQGQRKRPEEETPVVDGLGPLRKHPEEDTPIVEELGLRKRGSKSRQFDSPSPELKNGLLWNHPDRTPTSDRELGPRKRPQEDTPESDSAARKRGSKSRTID